jgi:hypothetical protein
MFQNHHQSQILAVIPAFIVGRHTQEKVHLIDILLSVKWLINQSG